MDAAEMLRRQRELRRLWHELDEPPRRGLCVRRPNDEEVIAWRDLTHKGDGEQLSKEEIASSPASMRRMGEMCRALVVDWRNFTEADLLGAEHAPPDPFPYSAPVFAEWVQDEPTVQAAIAGLGLRMYGEAKKAKAEAAKN